MQPDLAISIAPEIVITRFLFSDGHVMDVAHAVPDGSHVREQVLAHAEEAWGKDGKRKIEGSTRLGPARTTPSMPTVPYRTRTRHVFSPDQLREIAAQYEAHGWAFVSELHGGVEERTVRRWVARAHKL